MKTNDMIVQRVLLTHQWLRATTEELTEYQFNHRLSHNAPPVGWHLWHIARFADRLQASFSVPSGKGGGEIWEIDDLAQRWKLNPQGLGVLQSGMQMELDRAAALSLEVGKDLIQDYAARSFEKVDHAIAELSAAQFDETRMSVRAYKRDGERLVEATPDMTTTGADLIFHISHASRHLGSIEALLGAIE